MAEEKHKTRTLFVENLPYTATNEELEELFSQFGPLKRCFVVSVKDPKTETKRCRGFGYVTYATKEDTDSTLKKVLNLGGRKLKVSSANSKGDGATKRSKDAADKKIDPKKSEKEEELTKSGKKTEQSEKEAEPSKRKRKIKPEKEKSLNQPTMSREAIPNKKKARLIIRNLSFKCEEKDLLEKFSTFGAVEEVIIPKKENGKKRGFAFVQFENTKDATTAIEKMNEQTLIDRPVAVDWALSKDRFEQAAKLSSPVEEEENKMDNVANESEEEMSVDEDDDDEDDDDENDDDESGDASNNSEDDDDDDDDEDEDDEDDGDKEDDSEEDEDDSEEDDDSEAEMKKKKRPKVISNDVEEGRTLFIRNLSYDSMEEDLEELMEEFGPLNYCRIVIDPKTDHSRGTAFVQFKSKDDAEKCLAAAADRDQEKSFMLDGRKLNVSVALSRNKAQEMNSETKTKQEKVDQRNLHLIRETLIRPGTQAAEGLSKEELAKRLKVESITREKLKNPNIFVSPVRICIRNLPVNVDDSQLRKIFLKASGNPEAKITECRIMRDLDRLSSNGLGKSRGYGFVQFTRHEDALAAVRATNNSTEIFGEKRRPMVEFSLENKAALVAKERRREKSMKNFKSGPQKKSFTLAAISAVAPAGPVTKGKKQNPLPSHWGAKIRHKPRQPQKKEKKKSKFDQPRKNKEPKMKKRQKTEVRDGLDKLIDKYRQTFSAAVKQNNSRT